ncbi:GAF domain-containing protein [Nocardia transvalensis]|uniref:GAF domain-containing protein n=1 Tax=Nocardia transvalensis TaxID=37333 RepID=A0A7W9PKM6_9NOCA|nr:ANTAR domain-containing protein [Nocardia transvalensis]MBB5917258.1 GAF domain-containing protein [Nocardia transvalensis]
MPEDGRRSRATTAVIPHIDQAVDDVVALVARALPRRAAAGVTMRRAGAAATIAASAPLVVRVGEIVGERRAGPEWDAVAAAAVVSVPDLAGESRWDDYPARALALGIRSVHSHPVHDGNTPVATLDLYAPQPDAFDDGIRQTVAISARHIERLLHAAHLSRMNEQLRQALSSRSTIDQAVGILMGRRHCGREQAFEFLRAASQHHNVKLAVLAADIVTRVSGSAPEPAHFDVPGR